MTKNVCFFCESIKQIAKFSFFYWNWYIYLFYCWIKCFVYFFLYQNSIFSFILDNNNLHRSLDLVQSQAFEVDRYYNIVVGHSYNCCRLLVLQNYNLYLQLVEVEPLIPMTNHKELELYEKYINTNYLYYQ